ncbi:MAG TPA: hydrogenase maturation protease, partial [Kineosporiaceae bacterium]|nr:hydrogenase maturation protease [Kineosporiaceae bacterium]
PAPAPAPAGTGPILHTGDHPAPGPANRAHTGDHPDRLLVIGIGNDLRGDDGAGRAVVEDLAGRDLPGVRAIWSHQLVPELAEPIAAARCVVFVDCALPGHADGSGAERSGAERSGVDLCRIAPGDPAFGGHQAGPQSLLGLAQLAGLPVPPAYLLSLPAHDLGLGDQLSGPAGEAVAVAVGMILRLADAPLDPDPLDPDPLDAGPLDPDPLDAGPLDPDPNGVAPGADRAGDGASWCP